MTPDYWYKLTIGKSYDTDKYPRSNPYQCWDYWDFFCRYIECPCSRYCGDPTQGGYNGYAGYLWHNRIKLGYHKYFDFVDPYHIKEGDWLFWDRHVAFYFNNMEVGQNQNGRPYVTSMQLNRVGLLGGMRWKKWQKPDYGVAEHFSTVISGEYVCLAKLNMRTGGSTSYPVITVLDKGTKISCYGYYHLEGDIPWLYVVAIINGKSFTGFVCSSYTRKE
jgi:hypothetical protein